MHCNSLYSLSRHYINSLEVYNPPPSPKKECSDLKGTISSRYLLSFIVAPWIASLGPSGAYGRAVCWFLGGLGTLLESSGGGLWEVWGVLECILGALPLKKPPRIPRGAPKSSPRYPQEAPRGTRRPPKGSEETVIEAQEGPKRA